MVPEYDGGGRLRLPLIWDIPRSLFCYAHYLSVLDTALILVLGADRLAGLRTSTGSAQAGASLFGRHLEDAGLECEGWFAALPRRRTDAALFKCDIARMSVLRFIPGWAGPARARGPALHFYVGIIEMRVLGAKPGFAAYSQCRASCSALFGSATRGCRSWVPSLSWAQRRVLCLLLRSPS